MCAEMRRYLARSDSGQDEKVRMGSTLRNPFGASGGLPIRTLGETLRFKTRESVHPAVLPRCRKMIVGRWPSTAGMQANIASALRPTTGFGSAQGLCYHPPSTAPRTFLDAENMTLRVAPSPAALDPLPSTEPLRTEVIPGARSAATQPSAPGGRTDSFRLARG